MNALLEYLRENVRWLSAGVVLTFLSSFGQTFFISLFAGEIRGEFGLSHGEWGGIYALGTTTSAVAMVWAGALTDRLRVRALGAGVLVMLTGACFLMAANSTVWILPVVIFALRFSGQGMMSHLAVVAMARWFVATRGRALAIVGLGFSVGEAMLPLLVVALMTVIEWRLIWVGAGLIAICGLPLLLKLLAQERTPQAMSKSGQAEGMEHRHWTRKQALRHWLFWFMVPALLGPAAFSTAFFFNQVHFAEIKGWHHLELVALFPFFSLVAVGAMIVFGGALDRLGTGRLMPWYQVPMIAAFIFFSQASTPAGAFLGLFMMGVSAGANATLVPAFWAEYYGTRNIGSIKAAAAAIMVLGSAIGPGVTGVFIDLGVSLDTQYLGVAVYFAIASALVYVGISRAMPLLPARGVTPV